MNQGRVFAHRNGMIRVVEALEPCKPSKGHSCTPTTNTTASADLMTNIPKIPKPGWTELVGLQFCSARESIGVYATISRGSTRALLAACRSRSGQLHEIVRFSNSFQNAISRRVGVLHSQVVPEIRP